MAHNIGASTGGKSTPEWKNIDFGTTIAIPAGPDWGGGVGIHLNPIIRGVGNDGRIGRKVSMKKLVFRWSRNSPGLLTVGANNYSAPVPFRILLIYDRSPSGAVPPITDVLTSNNFEANLNLTNSDRFLVLSDQYPCETQGHNQHYMGGKIHVNFKTGLLAQFFDTPGGAIADMSAGAIYLYYGCSGATTAGSEALQFNSRIRYTDN